MLLPPQSRPRAGEHSIYWWAKCAHRCVRMSLWETDREEVARMGPSVGRERSRHLVPTLLCTKSPPLGYWGCPSFIGSGCRLDGLFLDSLRNSREGGSWTPALWPVGHHLNTQPLAILALRANSCGDRDRQNKRKPTKFRNVSSIFTLRSFVFTSF